MPLMLLFATTACLEALTGIALVVVPDITTQILLGTALSAAGFAVARLAGIALIALAVMAWVARKTRGRSAPLAAILTYNVLAAIYLAALDAEGALVGKLLLPAVVVHAALALLLLRAWLIRDDDRFSGR